MTQYEKMTETNVKKLITLLAIPTVISMLVTAIYNVADTFFVSRINDSASAAISVVFSLMTLIQSIGFTIGMGSGKPGNINGINIRCYIYNIWINI